MAREIESSPQTTEDEDARGMVFCCYGVKFVKMVWVWKVGVRHVLLLATTSSGHSAKISSKTNIVHVDVWKIWLVQKVYDYDVLFSRVNGICAVTWIKKNTYLDEKSVEHISCFLQFAYWQTSEYYVNRTHTFCLIQLICKNKVQKLMLL